MYVIVTITVMVIVIVIVIVVIVLSVFVVAYCCYGGGRGRLSFVAFSNPLCW